jgi:hypothetical protein
MTAARPRVTVVGGGLAGLTAALRLAERGYKVKLYEQKPMLGGNLASRPCPGDVDLDVYPHMYLGWYHNFWRLLEDASGVDRSKLFRPFESVKQLRRDEYPRFTALTDMYSPWHMLQNLFSGVGPPADMYVFGYASVDMLAERCNPTMLPDDVSVGGFLNARPYMTERAAAAYSSFISTVWAIPSSLASADDYRDYLAYCLAKPTPAYWLPRGSARRQVIEPLAAKLAESGVELALSVQVTDVACADGSVTEVGLRNVDAHSGAPVGRRFRERVEELVLAVPAPALTTLVRSGPPGGRIVEAAPQLADVSRLHVQQIPIMHVWFKRKLKPIPPEPVGLFGCRYELAFTDISRTWEDVPAFEGRTVLAVSASDPFGLPGTGPEADGYAMLAELAEFLDFDPGAAWGECTDVDWELTVFDANADARLFVNDAGTDEFRPAAGVDGLANLTLAGDFCANRIGMTTIESAVTTGLEAAGAIVRRRAFGAPVAIEEPDQLPDALWVWLRYAWAPYAAAAKAWSTADDCVTATRAGAARAGSALRRLLTAGASG